MLVNKVYLFAAALAVATRFFVDGLQVKENSGQERVRRGRALLVSDQEWDEEKMTCPDTMYDITMATYEGHFVLIMVPHEPRPDCHSCKCDLV